MVDPAVLPGFLVAVLLISLAPGTDMAFIIATSADRGSRSGVQAAVGMATGMVLWTLAATLGLGALLRAEPAVFASIRVLGALYLLWLGVRTLRSARARASASVKHQSASAATNLVWRGMLTNLTNPKILVFFVAFLPQFVRTSSGGASVQLLTLGGLFLLMGLGVDCLTALAAGSLRTMLRPGARTITALNVAAGATFCVLAAALAAEAVG
jgi:threonine/homoserine/homoserine lactone efflux protein